MILLTSEELLRIEYLDKIYASTDTETLRLIAEKEEVVRKLKGNQQPGPSFTTLATMIVKNNNEIELLQSSISSMRTDFADLLRYLGNVNNDANLYQLKAIKTRHGIY